MNTDQANFNAREKSRLEMGVNWLIDGLTVYKVIVWTLGGIADRQVFRTGDDGYESAYRAAVLNRNTLFRDRRRDTEARLLGEEKAGS